MIEPDIDQAAKEIRQMHCALDGFLMVFGKDENVYRLADFTQIHLKFIYRLITGCHLLSGGEVEIDD
jgi:hypothetical protein